MGRRRWKWYENTMSGLSSALRNASLIRGLQYFEAVARLGSVKLAADELGVSQSAVSHQLRDLTAALGEQLVVRSGRGIALSPMGQRLAQRLSSTFSDLRDSVDDIVGRGRQKVRLAVCSSFGPGWLIPRLGELMTAHPEIDLELHLYAQDPEQTAGVADAIVSALPVRPGYAAIHIIDETLVAVRAPQPNTGKLRLITTDIQEGQEGLDWQEFCDHAGLSLPVEDEELLKCTHYLLALEMARAGLGIALVPDFLARHDLESGRLVLFDETRMPSGRVYRLCFKTARKQDRSLLLLARWFNAQLAPEPAVDRRIRAVR